MSNSIDIISSREVQKGLDELYASLKEIHEEILLINKSQLSFNGGASPKSITDLNAAIKETIKQTEKLSIAERKLLTDSSKLERLRQAQINTQIKEIALTQKQITEKNKLEQAYNREKSKLEASQSLYNKVQTKLNALNNEYKNLAIQKELSGKLTDSEAKRYEFLSGKIIKYDSALKAVDGQMGKYQRNVGNYASAFNPLNNSINQLSREMPAFANSVQTGFMALSNNIPIFFDAMNGVIAQNKELQAQGKPTQSVFKQLASSIFGWGTALSIGITLTTVYGKEIGIWISNLIKGSQAIDSIKESQKQLNEINKEGQNNSVQETLNLKSLLEIAKDTSLSYKERVIAVNELQSTYPAYFGNLKKEEILAGNTTKAEKELTDAILSRAKANAAVEKITELQKEVIDIELKGLDLINKKNDAQRINNQAVKQSLSDRSRGDAAAMRSLQTTKNINVIDKEIIKNNKEKIAKQDVINRLSEFAIQKQKDSILLKYKETAADKVNTKAKEDKEKEDKIINKNTEEYFLAEISRLEKLRGSVADTTKEYESYNAQLELLKTSLMFLRGESRLTPAGMSKEPKAAPMLHELPKQFKKEIDEMSFYLKGFYDQFGSESGMPTLFKVLNNEIEGFGDKWKETSVAIMEIGQEMTNVLMSQSEARFNAEYSRLEQQKEIAIAFAGNSATAKAEVERQYEEKRKSIQRRQAESEKKQAMFNIAINTAQAIIATLGQTGFAGIPLSLIVAGIGAAQFTMVASQEIPAFAEGGVHEGGKMLINDAKGSKFQETVVTPDGKVRQFKGRNQVVNAPKGTQIFTPDQWSKQINNLLLKNNISPLQTNQTNGISKEDLESVFSKYSGTSEVAIDINENGFKKMITSNGRKREVLNSRLTTKGRMV